MSLFDRIVARLKNAGRKPPINETPQSTDLSDLIFDWFRESGLDMEEFRKSFLDPCLKVVQYDTRVAAQMRREPDQTKTHLFEQHSVLYLAVHNPDPTFLNRLFRLATIQGSASPHAIYFWLRSSPFPNLYKELQEQFKTILLGREILHTYHAIYVKKDLNMSKINRMGNTLALWRGDSNLEILNGLLSYAEQQEFKEWLSVLINARVVKPRWNKQEPEPEEQAQRLLKETQSRAIEKYNAQSPATIDEEIVEAFLDSVLSIGNTEIYKTTDSKKQRFLSVKNFPKVRAFLDQFKNQPYEVFSFLIYYLGQNELHRNHKKLYKDIVKPLLKKTVLTEAQLDSLLSIPISESREFIVTDIYTPLFKNSIEASNLSTVLLTKFENKLLGLIWHRQSWDVFQSAFDLVATRFSEIDEAQLQDIYRAKYQGLYFFADYNFGYIQMFIDGKKKVGDILQKLLQQLNQIFPSSLKKLGTYLNYGADNIKVATLNIDGQDYSFTFNIVNELNEILAEKKVGYRFLPIPILAYQDKKIERHYASIQLLNYQEYLVFQNVYLGREFPKLKTSKMWQQFQYEKQDAPRLTRGEEGMDSTGVANKFLSNPAWNWFKDGYVDKLSSKTLWYPIMEQLIECKGGTKPNKTWLANLEEAINGIGQERYYKELSSLMTDSLKEDFWYLDINRKAIKGIIWSCTQKPTETSLAIVKTIVEKAYTKIQWVGPKSAAVGNLGLTALATSGDERAFGLMNIMRNRSKYQRFINALDKNLAKFHAHSDLDTEALTDRTIPRFDFEGKERQVNIDEQLGVIYRIKKQSLTKKWVWQGKEVSKAPAELKTQYKAEEKEVAAEFKRIKGILKDIKERVKTYWLYNRTWRFSEWQKHLAEHPLIAAWVREMIWTNETQQNSFILREEGFFGRDGKPFANQADDQISFWHPITATTDEINGWQAYLMEHKIIQPLRQAYREHYPFSTTESALLESSRFSHHFLMTNKLMAIANSVGWLFTYAHEDSSWPRKFIKPLNLTIHLRCDYRSHDFAIPTKSFFFTPGDTRKLMGIEKVEKTAFTEVPLKTRSEVCRDADLFIATTSIANDPELSTTTEEQKVYREDYNRSYFSDNASIRIRKNIIQQLAPRLELNADFEQNYWLVKGQLNSYRINLGSGFAQIEGSQRHLNLLPDIRTVKKHKKLHLPIQDDETLYIILAKALFLSKDVDIEEEKIKKMLTGEA